MTTPNPQPTLDLEAVYDEKIFPLMQQILAICKEHNMPFIAAFQYAPESFCTSYLGTHPLTHTRLQAAETLAFLRQERDDLAAFVPTLRDGGRTKAAAEQELAHRSLTIRIIEGAAKVGEELKGYDLEYMRDGWIADVTYGDTRRWAQDLRGGQTPDGNNPTT